MPRNKNNKNHNPNQNKQHYHPRQQQQNNSKNQFCAAGRDGAYVRKQQIEQQERLAKLLEMQQKEVEKNAQAFLGPVGVCVVPQLLGTLARNREAGRRHEINLMNEAVNNPGPRGSSC